MLGPGGRLLRLTERRLKHPVSSHNSLVASTQALVDVLEAVRPSQAGAPGIVRHGQGAPLSSLCLNPVACNIHRRRTVTRGASKYRRSRLWLGMTAG